MGVTQSLDPGELLCGVAPSLNALVNMQQMEGFHLEKMGGHGRKMSYSEDTHASCGLYSWHIHVVGATIGATSP